jgi:hypothetical protein
MFNRFTSSTCTSTYISTCVSTCVSTSIAAAALIALFGCQTSAQDNSHAAHASADPRLLVRFPDEMRIHTLTNMRDHLLALQEIQEALAREQFDLAANIAEQRLGMSSLKLHGAHDVSNFMPAGMQAVGTEMHHAASRFALTAKDAGVTRDIKPALTALAEVSAQCVACHAGYRIQ